MNDAVADEVRRVLGEQGRLAVPVDQLETTASLYEAGMTSHASVNVMLALEDSYDLEFPDRMLTRDVFETIGSIVEALHELSAEAA